MSFRYLNPHSGSFPLHLKWNTNSLPCQVPGWAHRRLSVRHCLVLLCHYAPATLAPSVCFSRMAISLLIFMSLDPSHQLDFSLKKSHFHRGLLFNLNHLSPASDWLVTIPSPLCSFSIATTILWNYLTYILRNYLIHLLISCQLPNISSVGVGSYPPNPPQLVKCLA